MPKIETRLIVDHPEGPSPFQMQKVVMMTKEDAARLQAIQEKRREIAAAGFNVLQARSEGDRLISVLGQETVPVNLNEQRDPVLENLLLMLHTQNMQEMREDKEDPFTGGHDPMFR